MNEGLQQAHALWQSSMERWVGLAQKALPQSGISNESLKTLFDPGRWAQAGLGPLDAAIEHLVDGPSYATLWTLDRTMLKAQTLRAEWAKDLAAYQVLMHGAWNEAVKRFLQAINDGQGTPITTWRELTDVWIKVANDTLVETHRTPEFLETQRRLTRSGAECRLQERAIAEAFCEMQQTPTRTEMDEVQREVYELRRRLRVLEKSGVTASVPTTRSQSAPKPPTGDSRRTSSKVKT
jgi:polyhydroxyalkanoate synthesis regulator phasin